MKRQFFKLADEPEDEPKGLWRLALIYAYTAGLVGPALVLVALAIDGLRP